MRIEQRKTFTQVTHPEPHRTRGQEIGAKYPEIKKLFGQEKSTLYYILGLVTVQTGLAILFRNFNWWQLLIAAYVLGAFINHALFVLIHECTHNLVVKKSTHNRVLGIITNLPIGFPMAMSFRKYHLLHHKYQGDLEFDADLPTPLELKIVRSNSVLKSAWLFLFGAVESLRPMALKKIDLWDKWTFINLGVQAVYVFALVWIFGWGALSYLLLSSLFSVGLHPLGARWIQEHFIVHEDQETYSYYGILNKTAFNVGYHNEHHDFMAIPWSRLPKVRTVAPEYYDGLYFHKSWTKLLFIFLFNPNLSLYSRIIRTPAQQPQ